MTPDHRLAERIAAVTAPAGMAAYGVFRWIDGRDGDHGPGWAWDVGHVCFLVAMLAFGVFAVAAAVRLRSRTATAAAVAAGVGVAAFTWVIVGDLSPTFDDAVPVPDPVMAAGPILLLAGLLPLFTLVARERLSRWWPVAPLAGLAGFALISIDLDLLLAAAAAFALALVPLAVASGRDGTGETPRVTTPSTSTGRR